MLTRTHLFVAILLAGAAMVAGCGRPDTATVVDPDSVAAVGPALGKADGGDHGERDCNIVLREVSNAHCSHGFCGRTVLIDVSDAALAQQATPYFLYRTTGDSQWRSKAMEGKVGGAPAGFERFTLHLTTGYEGVELIPYYQLTDGTRFFEHNRARTGANYEVGNDGVPRDELTCAAAPPQSAGPALFLRSLSTSTYQGKGSLSGQIAVKNIAYHKTVAVRYTLDGWATTHTAKARYQVDLPGEYEAWMFSETLALPGGNDADLELEIDYDVAGQTYTDDNDQRGFELHVPASSTESLTPNVAFDGAPTISANGKTLSGELLIRDLTYHKRVWVQTSPIGGNTARDYVDATYDAEVSPGLQRWTYTVDLTQLPSAASLLTLSAHVRTLGQEMVHYNHDSIALP